MVGSVIKHFFTYAAGSVVQRALSFITYPFLMRYLVPAQMGLVALSNSFIAVISVIIGCGLRQLYMIEYVHLSEDDRRMMLADIIGIFGLLAAPAIVGLLLWYGAFNAFFFRGAAEFALYCLMVVQCIQLFFIELLYQILTYRLKSLLLTSIQLTVGLVTPFLLFSFVVHKPQAIMVLTISVSVSFCVAAYSIWFLWHESVFKVASWERIANSWRKYLRRGSVFIPTVLSGWLLASSSRWFLARYCSLDDVGIYSIAEMAGTAFQVLILQPLAASYLPQTLMRFAEHKDAPGKIERVNIQFMLIAMTFLGIFMTIAYGLGAPILARKLPVAYRQALPYALIIAYAYLFLLGTYFTTIYIQFCKRTDLLAYTIAITACVITASSMYLIPRYKMAGAAYSLAGAYALYFVLTLACNYLLHAGRLRSRVGRVENIASAESIVLDS